MNQKTKVVQLVVVDVVDGVGTYHVLLMLAI
jgi:hypothetical protein